LNEVAEDNLNKKETAPAEDADNAQATDFLPSATFASGLANRLGGWLLIFVKG
jgi:hypothetical protein